jgi:hypothetical protein
MNLRIACLRVSIFSFSSFVFYASAHKHPRCRHQRLQCLTRAVASVAGTEISLTNNRTGIVFLTNAFSAEYGGSAGSAVNIVTKSGGHQYHGSTVVTFRPSAPATDFWGFTSGTATSGNQLTRDELCQPSFTSGRPDRKWPPDISSPPRNTLGKIRFLPSPTGLLPADLRANTATARVCEKGPSTGSSPSVWLSRDWLNLGAHVAIHCLRQL